MAAFRRFDPYAVLAEDPTQPPTLAGLADLAEAPVQAENPGESGTGESWDRGDTHAKAANPAKPAEIHGTGAEQTAVLPLAVAAPSWGDAEEERVAIVEYDGGIPCAWAEGFARLDPGRPPADVPPRRWQTFVDDVGLFLDGDFASVASALGWGPYDLFGADRDRPFARIDQAGLLWLLNGDRLEKLSENTATIQTRTGARQIWRLKPAAPGRVLAWELAS